MREVSAGVRSGLRVPPEIAAHLLDEQPFAKRRKITYAPALLLRRRRKIPSGLPHALEGQRCQEIAAARNSFKPSIAKYDLPLLRAFNAANVPTDELVLIGKFHPRGVVPLRSAKTAEWMRKHVPATACTRQRQSSQGFREPRNQAREGRNICVSMIPAMREIPGVIGVHLHGLPP